MIMNKEIFYFVFGNKYTKIKDIFSLIKEQLDGNLSKKINPDELNWFVDIILGCLVEKDIKDEIFLKFSYDASVSIIKWINIFGDSDKFSDLMKKAKLINELSCNCLSIDSLIRLFSMWPAIVDSFLKTRPPGISMSRHYYDILHK